MKFQTIQATSSIISAMKQKAKGSIIIPAELDVWEHELRTAQVFARHGYVVQFLVASQAYRTKTADVLHR